jgi:two-component system alkaline phosphatase synthesis response regulator PhoP
MTAVTVTSAVVASVLIVDDDASIRALLGYVLHDEGYEVREAVDGEDALRELLIDPPDCMVLDLMMPKVDGVEVLRRREQNKLASRTRVLVLTAKTDTKDAVWCWELGADEYLMKPVDPERLAREVRLLLARTPSELRHRREVGLADARERDRLEQAFTPRDEP